jgi:hypothetical protein
MNDLKSLLLSAFPTVPAVLAAVESPSVLTIITTIVLPILFFVFSKTVDVLVQIYFKRKNK